MCMKILEAEIEKIFINEEMAQIRDSLNLTTKICTLYKTD